jgi:hypothetical protein
VQGPAGWSSFIADLRLAASWARLAAWTASAAAMSYGPGAVPFFQVSYCWRQEACAAPGGAAEAPGWLPGDGVWRLRAAAAKATAVSNPADRNVIDGLLVHESGDYERRAGQASRPT